MARAAASESYEPLDLHQRGDVCYALKRYAPWANRHCRRLTPREVKEAVFASPRLQRTIQEVAAESGQAPAEVEKEVWSLLEEIGHKMALPAVRTLAVPLRAAFRSCLRGVYVNREGMERVRKAVEQWPVILLPSHRTYLDFILVSFVMFEHNINLPCIAAGQDFMNMRGVSPFLRRSGAFFMRRTFGSDRLYRTIFSLYVQTLLCSGDSPLEFFIEGTRSRTAKSLHPRLGLLSMVVEPYLCGLLPDILLVPVSISYERTLEEELFARELLGIPKPRESTRALLKARSILFADYGSIFIHFSPPISLHEVCQARGVSRVPHTLLPKDVSVVLPGERQLVLELGHMIQDHTHQGMRIFPSALIAATLLQNTEGIQMSDLVRKVEWLRTNILSRGGTVNWEGGSAVDSSLKLLSTALEVTSDNLVKPRTGHLHSNLSSPLRHHSIEELTRMELGRTDYETIVEIAFVHLLLGHYRNQLLFLFVPEAVLALSLHGHMPCNTCDALRRFEALHCALAREFVFPLKSPKELFSENLRALLDRGVLQSHGEGEVSLNPYQEEPFLFLRNLLLPFTAGVWVVCQHLLSFAGGVQSLSATVRGAQLLAAKCIHAGLLQSYEVLSVDIVRNTLVSLTQAGLILQASSEVEGRDRLVKVADQEKLVQLVRELSSVLHVQKAAAKL